MKPLLFLILMFPIMETNGQTNDNNKAYLGFSVLKDMPSAHFSKQGYSSGAGMSFDYYSRDLIFEKSKTLGIRLGGSCFLARQNSVTNAVLLHDPYKAPGNQNLTNNHSGFDFQTMLVYEKGAVRPYADVFIGCGLFTANQNLTIDQPLNGYSDKTNTSKVSVSMDYGFSSGVLLKISKQTFINAKGSVYCFADKIQFDDLNHLGADDFMKVPNYVLTKPLMYTFQVGLIFKLLPSGTRPYYRGSGTHYYHGSGSHYYGGGGFHGGGGMPLR